MVSDTVVCIGLKMQMFVGTLGRVRFTQVNEGCIQCDKVMLSDSYTWSQGKLCFWLQQRKDFDVGFFWVCWSMMSESGARLTSDFLSWQGLITNSTHSQDWLVCVIDLNTSMYTGGETVISILLLLNVMNNMLLLMLKCYIYSHFCIQRYISIYHIYHRHMLRYIYWQIHIYTHYYIHIWQKRLVVITSAGHSA